MNNTVSRISVPLLSVLIAAFSFAMHADSQEMTNSDTPPGHADYRQIMRDIHNLNYDLRFEGEIVDPDGRRIPDVKVLSSKSKGIMSGSSEKEEYLIKDGIFSFKSKGVYAWGLTFEKDGYYKTVIPMGSSHVADVLTREDKSYSFKNGIITEKTRVVLYPYGIFNGNLLEVDNNILTFSDHGISKTIICVVIPYQDGERHREDHEFEYTFTDETKLPGNLIYIVPGYKPDGTHDGTIRLKTSGMGSGFLPVKYDGPHCFRSMWEAPEEGDYRPELVIEDGLTNYLKHNYVNPKSVGNIHIAGIKKSVPITVPHTVFFFRVNGYYRKGLIMPGDGDSFLEETRASLRIYLYVSHNPGIRNTNVWLGTDW